MRLDPDQRQLLIQQRAQLAQERCELNLRIEQLANNIDNQLEVTRLKKKKLKLKDQIAHIDSELIPDLHA